MKSKQINFFAVYNDLTRFEEYFRKKNILFIKVPFYDNKVSFVDNNLAFRDENKEWGKIYLTKREFFNAIKIKYVEPQKFYLIDEVQSYVVEFSRPLPDLYNGYTERSRLYFIKSHYNNEGTLINKDKSFINWAEALLKDFSNEFLISVPHDKNFAYTQSTLEMIELEKIHEQLPLKMHFKIEE